MEYLYKALICATFGVPAILSIAMAEWGKGKFSIPSIVFFYGFGAILAICALVLPWAK
jgi:hypothetical protein